MPETPAHGLRYPAYNVAADIPQDIRNLAEDVEEALAGLDVGGYSEGTLADRPAAGAAGRVYRVNLGAGQGRIFIDTGSSWAEPGSVLATLRAVAAAATDVPVTAQGAASQSGNLAEFKNSGGTVLAAVRASGRPVFPVDPVTSFTRDSANGNRVTKITVTSGGTTLKTTDFTYNGDGTVATITESGSAEGRTVTSTFTYSGGVLQSVSKAVS